MFHRYEVGRPYLAGRTSWDECVVYQFRAGAHELLMFLASPTPAEVAAVQRGEAEFALLLYQGAIFFLYRFAAAPGHATGIPWGDCPFSWHLVLPPEERVLPEPLPSVEARHLLNVTLIDASTGLVRVLRATTLSPAFTAELHDAIRQQAEAPWDPAAHDRAISRAYAKWPQTGMMLAAARTRTKGGD